MNVTVNFTVNGRKTTVTTDGDRPLLDVLREDLQLLGAKYGCGEGRCGACGVLSDGKRIFTCITPVKEAEGTTLVTIEGLSEGEKLHPVQEAFLAEGAYQCGYCTPGMVIAAVSLLKAKPRPTEAEIVAGMNRNLCRCCGYPKIVKAIERAAAGTGR
ncbi:MAG: (2Fe-2S)-binding protein [Tepidisphaeraceae bacterium]|jgi:aerobic-type carbon monoxide dehydrogenase small subunit (CoxS/CutS family)